MADVPGHAELEAAARRAADRLIGAGCLLATAESCTGGWIAKVLTDLPGSSAWFVAGVVSYANAAKTEWLGVPATLLETDGAVSEPVARAMATGVLGRAGADVSLAVTGVAGPGGGSAAKPVGTVWFAWATAAGEVVAERCRFAGDREAVRRATVCFALDGLARVVAPR